MLTYFLLLKGILLLGLVRSFVTFEPLQKHWIFFAILYTALLGGASWVLLLNMPGTPPEWWQTWMIKTFLVVLLYFKLLSKFDEGALFWIIFLTGFLGLMWF